MKTKTVKRLLCALIIGMLMTNAINPIELFAKDDVNGRSSQSAEYIDDQLIVKFTPGITGKVKAALMSNYGIVSAGKSNSGFELVVNHGNMPLDVLKAALENNKNIELVEYNHILAADAVTAPNDPSFYRLWGLENTAAYPYGGTVDTDIDILDAWENSTGSGVVVAVIDTGIQITHADLANNIWHNLGESGIDTNGKDKSNNGIDDDGNGYIDDFNGWDFYNGDNSVYDTGIFDDDGHGTHVSGTIAATANNGVGISGGAPGVQIMPLKFLGSLGGNTYDAILAIEYATSMGANVINASWGGGGYNSALETVITEFGMSGGLFIAAAGNGDNNGNPINNDILPHYPSSYNCSNIISVAAANSYGQSASFSNYGLTSVDVAAPGVDIYSTHPNGYAWGSGTSMATPHVSAIAALLYSHNPNITYSEAWARIVGNTVPLADFEGKIMSGGMVNANLAFNNDISAPVLQSSTPSDGEENISLDLSEIQLIFDEIVRLDSSKSGDITLKDPNGDAVYITTSTAGKSLSVIIVGEMAYSTQYTLDITAGAAEGIISDLFGNPYVGSINFTTMDEPPVIDILPPTVVESSPLNGETNVEVNKIITITYDEPIEFVGTAQDAIKLTAGRTLIPINAVTDGNRIVITQSGLDYNTSYKVEVIRTKVSDTSGNATKQSYKFTFTTIGNDGALPDTMPPQLDSSNPSNGDVNIPVSTPGITLYFNEDVDINENVTSGFVLSGGAHDEILLPSVSGNTVTLTIPENHLDYLLVYTLTVADGVIQDTSENANPYGGTTITFTTENNPNGPIEPIFFITYDLTFIKDRTTRLYSVSGRAIVTVSNYGEIGSEVQTEGHWEFNDIPIAGTDSVEQTFNGVAEHSIDLDSLSSKKVTFVIDDYYIVK